MKWLHTGKKFENKWKKPINGEFQEIFILHKVHFLKLFSSYSEGDTAGKQHLMLQTDYKSDLLTFTYPIPIFFGNHIHSFFLQLN